LNAEICLIPFLPKDSPISLHRLSPAHSNLRISTHTVKEPSSTEDAEKDAQEPSPGYNTAFLATLSTQAKHQIIAAHSLKENCHSFNDAVTLLRVWANQRGFGDAWSSVCVRGFDGKGAFWPSVLELLLNGDEPLEGELGAGKKDKRRKTVGRGVSSYQLFKAALDFLSELHLECMYRELTGKQGKSDFEKKPVYVKTSEGHRVRSICQRLC
jgi:U3 small nucleolar RNA-associated protein 22